MLTPCSHRAHSTHSTRHRAPAAQVLCWSSLGLATMAGSAAKGALLSAAGVRALYAVCAATGAAVYGAASRGWLGDAPIAPAARHGVSAAARRRGVGGVLRAVCAGVLRPARADASTALFRLALIVTACALTQGAIGVATTAAPAYVMPACGAAICVVVVASCWSLERRALPPPSPSAPPLSPTPPAPPRQSTPPPSSPPRSRSRASPQARLPTIAPPRRVSPTLAKASMYIFLDAAVQPHSLVIYKWCKATPDNCDAARHAHPRPCFTPEFIGGHRGDNQGTYEFMGGHLVGTPRSTGCSRV